MKISISGAITKKHLRAFSIQAHFDEIDLRNREIFTVSDAEAFKVIQSVGTITLWCEVTRAALRHIVSCPNLKELVVFHLRSLGTLTGFEKASYLTYFSALYGLKDTDLLQISKCASLEKLGAQQAEITKVALLSLMQMPSLTEVDFECSNFNDDLAELISQSRTITRLEVGATRITKTGLKKICSMQQLKGLDIWANDICEADLDLLSSLLNLEYLSIGGHDEQTVFSARNTLPKLEKLPSLKRVWLDGLHVTKDEWADLNERYEFVKVTKVT